MSDGTWLLSANQVEDLRYLIAYARVSTGVRHLDCLELLERFLADYCSDGALVTPCPTQEDA